MEPILKLNDLDVFPNKEPNQVDSWSERKTVKIFLVSGGELALVTNPIHKCFLLPGGGIEEGEDVAVAADRECREEVGQGAVEVCEVGMIDERRARGGKHYLTYGVIAQAGKLHGADDRTENEKDLEMTVEWRSVAEVLRIFKEQNERVRKGEIEFYNTAFNIVRDAAFLDEAINKGLLAE
jgi:ADP-ribose pyrophosphatase YjhB (NUDIX family)